MPVKVLLCYAIEDKHLVEELKTHLLSLQRYGLIEMCYDQIIDAGAEREREITDYLNTAHIITAQIILLLISPHFMASDYCYNKEMQRAIERHERGEARVIPIILRDTLWQIAPFSKLQALPTGAKPVVHRSWRKA